MAQVLSIMDMIVSERKYRDEITFNRDGRNAGSCNGIHCVITGEGLDLQEFQIAQPADLTKKPP